MTINFDLATGTAKLAQTTTIKAGADVPVRVVFSTAPAEVSSLQFALGDSSTAAVLAFTDEFAQENATTWTALLDAGDPRLATALGDDNTLQVNAEFTATIAGARLVTPNLPVTVQPAIIRGPDTPPTGPGIRLTDSTDGHTYRLVSNNGALGLELIS
jgi:hypothetical protein